MRKIFNMSTHATSILNLLKSHLDFSKELVSQLGSLFIPSFSENDLYLQSSWRGRLQSFLTLPWQKNATVKKTHTLVLEALESLAKAKVSLGQEIKIASLYDELKKEEGISSPLSHLEIKEISELQRKRNKKAEAHQKNIERSSLFRNLKNSEPLDLETFQSLFKNDHLEREILFIEKFLEKNPKYAAPKYAEMISRIRRADAQDKSIYESFFPQGKLISAKERDKLLRELSAKMAREVQALKTGQKKLTFFSYGNPHITLDTLFAKMRLLPENQIQNLPEFLLPFIKEGKAPNAEEFTEKLIKKCFAELKENQNLNEEESNRFAALSSLFKEDSRKIPDAISGSLPLSLEKILENVLAQGAIGNTLSFIDNPHLQAALVWLNENGLHMLDVSTRKQVYDKIEEKLISFVHEKIETHFHKLQKTGASHLQRIAGSVPGELLELAGVDDFLLSGPLWMEFQREQEGCFSLNISSLGKALRYHTQDDKTKKPLLTLRLKDIEEGKLNSSFFFVLLSRHLSPNWKPDSIAKAYDIYSGPIESLGGKCVPPEPHDQTIDALFPSNPSRLMQTLLLEKASDEVNPLFEMHLEALLQFCHPLLDSEKKLVIPNNATCGALEKAFEAIQKEFDLLKNSIKTSRVQSIKSTLHEVKEATLIFRNKEKKSPDKSFHFQEILKEETLKEVAKALFEKGRISQENLTYFRDIAEWALGTEAGMLIDEVLSYYKELIPGSLISGSSKSLKKKPVDPSQGWLVNTFSGLYLHIAWKLAQVALTLAGIYSGGFSYVLTIPFILNTLPHVLPPEILEWYNTVFNAVKVHLVKWVFEGFWHYALNQEVRQKLSKSKEIIKDTLLGAKKSLDKEQKISFSLKKPFLGLPARKESLFAPNHLAEPLKYTPIKVDLELPSRNKLDISAITSKASLEKKLALWKEAIQKREGFVFDAALTLPMPSATQKTIWDTIEEPTTCMDLFFDLSLEMTQIFNHSIITPYNEEHLRYVVANHKILAILFHLAKRVPETNLEGYQLVVNSLFQIYTKKDLGISDPLLQEEISNIIAYLAPEIDLGNLLTDGQIEQYNLNSLFHTSSINVAEGFLIPSMAEHRYLINWLKTLNLEPKFNALGLFNLNVNQKVFVLFQESLVMTRASPFFPRAFSLLKLHSLLCQTSFKQALPTDPRKVPPPPYYYPSKLSDLLHVTTVISTFADFIGTINRPNDKVDPEVFLKEKKTQTENMQVWVKNPANYSTLSTFIHSTFIASYHPSEQLPIWLKYLENNLEFILVPQHIEILQVVFFSPGRLKAFIKKSPQAIFSIGNLFKKWMEFLPNELKEFRILGLQVKRFCEHYAQGSGKYFPPFQETKCDLKEVLGLLIQNNHLKLLLEPIVKGFRMVENEGRISILEDETGEYRLNLGIYENECKMRLFQKRKEVWYELQIPIKLPEPLKDYKLEEKLKCGKEELIYLWKAENGSLIAQIAGDSTRTVEVDPSLFVQEGKDVQQIVPPKYYLSSINPILRFCPAKNISATAIRGQSHLSTLHLKRQNLSFAVEETPGGLVARSKEFENYFLAVEQEHASVKGFASYLILENSAGKRKVLIARNQWLQGFCSRFLFITGPFERIILDQLASIQEIKSDDYFVFDISDNETKGSLESNDPLALAYLLLEYIAKGNISSSEKTCQKLEWLCRSQAIPKETKNILSLLAFVPFEFESIGYIRRRLFSVLEQNRLFFNEKETDDKVNLFLQLLVTGITLYDLQRHVKSPDPRQLLSKNQEFFLFKSAFRGIGEIVKEQLKLPFNEYLETLGWDKIIVALNVIPLLSSRYKELCDTKDLWILEEVVKVLMTPSSLPNLHISLDKYRAAPLERKEGLITTILQAFSVYRDNYTTDVKALNLEELYEVMADHVHPHTPLEADTFKPQTLKRNFPAYYAIARGDFSDDLKTANQSKEKLNQLLALFSGGWDHQTKVLLFYLKAISAYPSVFPTTSKLLSLLNENNGFHEISLPSVPFFRWRKFFEKLNNQILKTYTTTQFIDPAIQHLQVKLQGEIFLNRFLGLFPSHLNNSVANLINLIGRGSFRTIGRWHLANGLEPLRKKLPSVTVLTKEDVSGKDVLRTAGNIAVGMFGGLGLSLLLEVAGFPIPSVSQTFGTFLLASAGSGLLNYGYATRNNKRIGWTQLLPWPYFTYPAVSLASKVYNAHTPSSMVIKREKIKPAALPDFSSLKVIHDSVGQFLDELFLLAFTQEVRVPQETRLKPLKSNSVNPLVVKRFEKVNTSLSAYYQQLDKGEVYYTLKKREALTDIYIRLKYFVTSFVIQIKEEKKQLLALFNTSLFGKSVGSVLVTLPDLISFTEKGSFGALGKEIGITDQMIPHLELALAKLHLKISLLAQMEKNLRLLDSISKESSPSSLRYLELVESLAIELKKRGAFDLATTPRRLTKMNLLFQAATGHLLWSEQAQIKEQVLCHSKENVVTEEAPGAGKTFTMPLTAAHEMDGKTLYVAMAPQELAGINQLSFDKLLKLAFHKTSHALHFERQSHLTKSTIEALLTLMTNAKEEGEALQMTKDDAKALRSILDERLDAYFEMKEKDSQEKECLIALHKILHLIFHMGLFNPDEAHLAYRFRHQLNFTIGLPKTIKDEYYVVVEKVMRELINDPGLNQAIRANELFNIQPELYEKIIMPRIAKILCEEPRFKLNTSYKKTQFIAFITDNGTKIYPWMTQDPILFEQYSLIKGVLTVLFPLNFKNRTHVEYMASKKEKGDFARPADGNSHVVEQDTIQSPYETLVKTFLMLFSQGLNASQSQKLTGKLREMVAKEASNKGSSNQETEMYKRFKDLKATDSEASILFMRYFVWKEIRYWKKCISSSSYDFSMLPKRQISGTGTPYNESVYPAELKVLSDPIALGKLLHLINDKCPVDGIHVLEKIKPKEVLEEILLSFFGQGSFVSALIDGGPLFTGLSNEEVARDIFTLVVLKREDLKAVKFYKENEQEKEQVYCFCKGFDKPVLAETLHLTARECLTYYDQRHGFGADEEQWGDPYTTFGPFHPFFRWIQEAFRVRPLKKRQHLVAIGSQPVQIRLPKLHVGMTKDIAKMITQKEGVTPTKEELYCYGITNEGLIEEADNYPAMRGKISTTAKKAVYKKIMGIPSEDFEQWSQLWLSFKELFITEIEDNPGKIFGQIKTRVSPELALQTHATQVFDSLDQKKQFSSLETLTLKTALSSLPTPTMPSKVTAWKKNKDDSLSVDHLSELGTTQTVQAQLHQEFQQHEVQQKPRGIDFKFTEWDWNSITDVASLSWLTFSSPLEAYSPFADSKYFKKTCPFYKVQDLLQVAKLDCLKRVSSYFDPRLWMSNNFVPRNRKIRSETVIDIGSPAQFQLNQVLLHLQINQGSIQILYAGPLSIKDAEFWRKILTPDDHFWQKKAIKTLLWDANLRTVQAGYPLDQDILRAHKDLSLVIGQLKFLEGDVRVFHEKEALSEWIKSFNYLELKEAFEAIHSQRKTLPYPNSEMDQIFTQVSPSSFFDK